MADSLSGVYDLAYPSPIPLIEITSIEVVVRLWRKEIDSYFKNKTSEKFDLTEHIRLENAIPQMPSTIYDLLDEYSKRFRDSLVHWLRYHFKHIYDGNFKGDSYFNSSDNFKGLCYDYILSNFHDFVWDWNGAIHFVHTARRMLRCDRFSLVEKFKIACLYCFEDDVKRIWPSVSTKMNLYQHSWFTFAQLRYWIFYPRGELDFVHEVFGEQGPGFCVDELMLRVQGSDNQSTVEYFWNRIRPERRSKAAIFVGASDVFARFILPKLNEHQLEEYLTEEGADLIPMILPSSLDSSQNYDLVFSTWLYIRHKINGNDFKRLVMELLVDGKYDRESSFAYFCCEIWGSAPQHLKQSVLDDLFLTDSLRCPFIPYLRRKYMSEEEFQDMRFLIVVIRNATFEERSSFWRKYWRNFLCGVCVEDLSAMMKLCFRNEHEIISFKENVMAIGLYEKIEKHCASLMNRCDFKKLNDFLNFCCPDEVKRRELKQRLLQSSYLGESSILRANFVRDEKNHKLLNEFVEDAFENADLRVEFKNQFISSPGTVECLSICIESGDYIVVMDFVDTFVSDERVVLPLKENLLEYFKEYSIAGRLQRTDCDDFQKILVWLLSSEDEVAKFKQLVSEHDADRAAIQVKLREIETKKRMKMRTMIVMMLVMVLVMAVFLSFM